jgi:hypothetical protein
VQPGCPRRRIRWRIRSSEPNARSVPRARARASSRQAGVLLK